MGTLRFYVFLLQLKIYNGMLFVSVHGVNPKILNIGEKLAAERECGQNVFSKGAYKLLIIVCTFVCLKICYTFFNKL